MRDHIGGYSFGWSQPYPTWQSTLEQVHVMNEMARLDFLEEQVQMMSHYPDAENIINKIKNSS